MVHGERFKIKRSELIEAYSLEGCPDHVIVSVAQKHMAADQRLARVKEREAENPPHGSEPGASEAPAPGAPEPTNPSARAYAPEADGLDPDRSPDGQNQPLPPEKLAEIVEWIQIGDTERLIETRPNPHIDAPPSGRWSAAFGDAPREGRNLLGAHLCAELNPSTRR